MSYTKWYWNVLTPSLVSSVWLSEETMCAYARDGVNVTATDTTTFALDLNVIRSEGLWLYRLKGKFVPVLAFDIFYNESDQYK